MCAALRQKNTSGPRVLLVGDVMRDVLVAPEGQLREGSDRKARIEIKPGGSAANQAVWLAHAGVPCTLVAKVGLGDRVDLEKQFKGHGVDPSFIADKKRSTGVLVSMIAPDGERSFFTDRGANEELGLKDLPDKILDGISLILLSGYSFFVPGPRSVVLSLIDEAKARGVPVAIDPASAGFIADVGVENFLNWTGGTDILFPNAEEAALLSGQDRPQDQLRLLEKRYGRVVLKCGKDGAKAFDEQKCLLHVPAENVEVVDTTGAGDAFVGGFLARHLAGEDLLTCLKNGVGQGAVAVTGLGGQPS